MWFLNTKFNNVNFAGAKFITRFGETKLGDTVAVTTFEWEPGITQTTFLKDENGQIIVLWDTAITLDQFDSELKTLERFGEQERVAAYRAMLEKI